MAMVVPPLRNGASTPNRKRAGMSSQVDEVFWTGKAPDAQPKKRKKEGKRPAFKPQPIAPNSSDTPPDDDIILPPPPSEKKIARRRESTRAVRERPPSTSPEPKRQKVAKSSSRPPDLPTSSQNAGPSMLGMDFLEFSKPSRPRASMARPASPPTHASRSRPSMSAPSIPTTEMGPPTGFVRKTRKSMRGVMPDISGEAVVPVPDSETPMIRKNKELRAAQERRSSMGMRGQRASLSLGRGEISIPHHSVESAMFYKHISSTLPEPIRARHLLVFCAKRAADAEMKDKGKKKAEGRTQEGDEIVGAIMDEFITTLGKGGVDTNVFAGVGSSSIVPIRPHPRNASNREVEAKMATVIKRCKDEDRHWSALIHRANRKQTEVVNTISKKAAVQSMPSFSNLPEDEAWMSRALQLADNVLGQGDGDLASHGEFEDVEFKVDTLLQRSHSALQYSLQATRFLDGIFSSLTSDLRARAQVGEGSSLPSNGAETDAPDAVALLSTTAKAKQPSSSRGKGKDRDPMAMLRALAAVDARDQSSAAVEAAARLPPASLSSSTSHPPSATPRRPAVTPRRVGAGTTPRTGLGGRGGLSKSQSKTAVEQ